MSSSIGLTGSGAVAGSVAAACCNQLRPSRPGRPSPRHPRRWRRAGRASAVAHAGRVAFLLVHAGQCNTSSDAGSGTEHVTSGSTGMNSLETTQAVENQANALAPCSAGTSRWETPRLGKGPPRNVHSIQIGLYLVSPQNADSHGPAHWRTAAEPVQAAAAARQATGVCSQHEASICRGGGRTHVRQAVRTGCCGCGPAGGWPS